LWKSIYHSDRGVEVVVVEVDRRVEVDSLVGFVFIYRSIRERLGISLASTYTVLDREEDAICVSFLRDVYDRLDDVWIVSREVVCFADVFDDIVQFNWCSNCWTHGLPLPRPHRITPLTTTTELKVQIGFLWLFLFVSHIIRKTIECAPLRIPNTSPSRVGRIEMPSVGKGRPVSGTPAMSAAVGRKSQNAQ